MYELFDHTADVGLRMRAGSLDELFAEAGRALFSVIVANFDAVRPVQELALRVEGSRRDDLLFDWLAELLYTFDARRVLASPRGFVRAWIKTGLGDELGTLAAHPPERAIDELEELAVLVRSGAMTMPEAMVAAGGAFHRRRLTGILDRETST